MFDSSASVTLLRRLVDRETPSTDPAACRAAMSELEPLLREAGGDVRLVESGRHPLLRADFPGPGAPELWLGHIDTVWPHGTLDVRSWMQQGERVGAPGVYDMKAGLVVMVEALRRAPVRRRAVRVLVTSDEEIGSRDSEPALREAAAGCRCVLGFEPGHPDGALKSGRIGNRRIRLSATGIAAHAGLDPDAGVSAIDELVDALLAVRRFAADVEDRTPGQLLTNIGSLSAPGATNVVSATAEARLELRTRTRETEIETEHFLAGLRPQRARAELTVETLTRRPAWLASPADIALAARLLPDPPARPASGASDLNLLADLGIPLVDGLGPRGGGAHAADEWVDLRSLEERIALVVHLLTAPGENA